MLGYEAAPQRQGEWESYHFEGSYRYTSGKAVLNHFIAPKIREAAPPPKPKKVKPKLVRCAKPKRTGPVKGNRFATPEERKTVIQWLGKKGNSYRQLGIVTGIHRETIRKAMLEDAPHKTRLIYLKTLMAYIRGEGQ